MLINSTPLRTVCDSVTQYGCVTDLKEMFGQAEGSASVTYTILCVSESSCPLRLVYPCVFGREGEGERGRESERDQF